MVKTHTQRKNLKRVNRIKKLVIIDREIEIYTYIYKMRKFHHLPMNILFVSHIVCVFFSIFRFQKPMKMRLWLEKDNLVIVYRLTHTKKEEEQQINKRKNQQTIVFQMRFYHIISWSNNNIYIKIIINRNRFKESSP